MANTKTITFHGEEVHIIGPMDGMLKVLEAALRMTRRPERMCLIVGEQGMGKTLGARLFCEQMHPDDAIYVQIPPASVMRPGRLLQLLEAALDLPIAGPPTLFDRLQAIIASLRSRPRALVFDNANRIRKYDYIDMLRYVHDEAGARMVFVSIPSLEHVFRQHREFAGRLQIYHQVRPATRQDIAAVLSDFPEDMIGAIYDRTGGRMRETMVLAEIFRTGIERTKWSAAAVNRVAQRFTLGAVA